MKRVLQRARMNATRGITAFVLLILLSLLAAGTAVSVHLIQDTARPPAAVDAHPTERAASIHDLTFLAGAWIGTIGQDKAEEHWSQPAAGNIMGMFRWIGADDSLRMLEILSITEENETIHLRLIHYSSTLQPWESEPVHLQLAALEPRMVRFEPVQRDGQLQSITYDCRVDDHLTITVKFRADAVADSDDAPTVRPPLIFELQRAGTAKATTPQ